jgi:acyl carrier protein
MAVPHKGAIDMSASVLDRVKKVTCEELGVSENEVTEAASFVDDLGADSLDLVELVMAFEEEFGVDVPDDDAASLKTVGDAVGYIEKKL